MPRVRRGMALVPVVLLVSALLLVAVAFADAMLQAMRSARLGWQGERALHEADHALLSALDRWDGPTAAALRPGESDTLTVPTRPGSERLVLRTRLQARVFALVAEARVRDGGSRPAVRRVGRTVRLDWPVPPVLGALTTGGAVDFDAEAVVVGADGQPAGWEPECVGEAAAAVERAAVVRTAQRDSSAIVSGRGVDVHLLTDSSARAFAEVFDASFAALARHATGSVTDSVLSMDDLDGTGCPRWFGAAARRGVAAPCTRRWPIVLAHGSAGLRLTGTTPGQGVLLVDGDLRLDHGVRFAGLLLVRGRLDMDGSGGAAAEVAGAVVVRDEDAGGSRVSRARIVASRCAVRRALAASARPLPIRYHAWSERP